MLDLIAFSSQTFSCHLFLTSSFKNRVLQGNNKFRFHHLHSLTDLISLFLKLTLILCEEEHQFERQQKQTFFW